MRSSNSSLSAPLVTTMQCTFRSLRRLSVAILPMVMSSHILFAQTSRMNAGETVADAAVKKNPAMKEVPDIAGLPRVLLIGDSISIGYTLRVRELLTGKANVHRVPANAAATAYGLEKLDAWLGTGKWDVIHFNFGLHDAKLPPEGKRHTERDVYERNLRELVKRLGKTNARLIWANTTPVPNDGVVSPTRRFDDITERNRVAQRVMSENHVTIDDLNSIASPTLAKIQKPNDVHFFPEGSDLLAQAVAHSIALELAKR